MVGYNYSQYLRENLSTDNHTIGEKTLISKLMKNVFKHIRARAPLKIYECPPGEACPPRLKTTGLKSANAIIFKYAYRKIFS